MDSSWEYSIILVNRDLAIRVSEWHPKHRKSYEVFLACKFVTFSFYFWLSLLLNFKNSLYEKFVDFFNRFLKSVYFGNSEALLDNIVNLVGKLNFSLRIL
jgi:hypothetical protein